MGRDCVQGVLLLLHNKFHQPPVEAYVCTTDGEGNCKVMNVNYQLTCDCGDRYIGSTTRSAHTKGKEHMRELD